MSFHVQNRWGVSEANPSPERIREVLAELETYEPEHPSACLAHESEWILTASTNGLLIWEHAEEGEPRHMRAVRRDRVLDLWLKLSRGEIAVIEAEPWQDSSGL
jgi:hypothetical protein